jgi:AraC family transcriptional regulator
MKYAELDKTMESWRGLGYYTAAMRRAAVNLPGAELGSVNSILRATARRHDVRNFAGPLSIKSVIDGAVSWKMGRREVAVDERSFLILNDGEPYSMEIDSIRPVTTCCVFFERGFVEEVYRDFTGSDQRLEFLSGLHMRDRRILPRMELIHRSRKTPSLWLDQQFLLLAHDLLLLHGEARRQIERLPAVRESTRTEAFKRLSRGREFIHANLDQDITLERIARAAAVSAYHFHRLFVRAFRESPHAYLTRLRLDRARWLISTQDRPLVEICSDVGFESLGSFSLLFRRKFGMPPGTFRRSSN